MENTTCETQLLIDQVGSPPHTWRIRFSLARNSRPHRITSTHVENTSNPISLAATSGDHLHTRGEYNKPDAGPRSSSGSPPHTWRILATLNWRRCAVRITSTHVENTHHLTKNVPKLWDHLHTRGEYKAATSELLTSLRITSTHVENTVNKSQYNNNHKTIDPKISSLCQLLLYLFLSH